jgi:hypothetical protein
MTTVFKQRSLWDDPPGPRPTDARLHTAFERSLTRGLLAEWENASWLLPDPMRQALRKPLFCIRDMGGRLGSWNPDKRQITLDRQLVHGHRWDDIKDVLLHEMAHQVAGEVMGAHLETDHGDTFREACRLLRATPRASGTYPTLRERLRQGEALDDTDRMVVRIHKLMALAESSNANEAHAAMRKAHELIARYNLDLIGREVEQDYVSLFIGSPRLRHFRETYHLAHLLQDFYFIQCMWIEAWVVDKEKMGRVLEISGSRKNVMIAEYVHGAVKQYIDAAWEDYRQDQRLNRYRKTDFAVGVIQGFADTLKKAQPKPTATEKGHLPVRLEDPALGRYMSRRYPNVSTFSRRGPGHDARVLADGTEKGRQLVIAKGICQEDGYCEGLLEYEE